MSPKNLLREPLLAFKPYTTGKPIEEVRRQYGLTGRIAKLASNENPMGTSPKALAAMHDAVEQVAYYPDDNAYYFKQKLSELYNCDLENVIIGSGSVEILEQIGIAFLNPGDQVVTSQKTFAMYEKVAQKAGAVLKMAPMIDGGFRYDLDALAALIEPATKVVFLANPTNPTGTWFNQAEFDAFMAKVPEDTLVVYDCAYSEYVTVDDLPDPMPYFHAGRRILYLRTLSKAYGLAGVRIGYGIGPADIIQGINLVRTPFNANLVALAAGMAALDDHEFVAKVRDYNTVELAYLRENLQDLPITMPPSQTNFLLIVTEKRAVWLFEELQKAGVIVRPIGERAIRVNTGLHEDNVAFVEHFRRLMQSPEGRLLPS